MGARPSRVSTDHEIKWYRTPLPKDVSARLHELSDLKALAQTLGWLGLLALWGGLATRAYVAQDWPSCVAFALAYGAQANFAINAMHELGHGYVFRTRALNSLFLRVISFLGWLHPDLFFSSHWLHHRFTQNPPHDLENPMPVRFGLKDFLLFGFVNVKGFLETLAQTLRAALCVYPTGHLGWLPEWEERLYREDPGARTPSTVWAWALLLGHAAVAYASFSAGVPIVSFLVSFGAFYNGWLFFLCNTTQHVGLHPNKSDFRLNSRTFYLNPFVSFLYWHMNWHTEHHSFPAVPCYNLAALHEAIKHDLPPPPDGIVGVWRVVTDCLAQQARDPTWAQPISLPGGVVVGGPGSVPPKSAGGGGEEGRKKKA
jgi:fatty acid desaturase